MSIPVVMPQLGESVIEGVVTRWRVHEGDLVQRDQPLCDVETDKAQSEVPSPATGRVARLLAREGETVATGKPILEIDEDRLQPPLTQAGPEPRPEPPPPVRPQEVRGGAASSHGNGHQRLSPVVRRIADERGVDPTKIQGTGGGGRVTKQDLMRYLGEGAASGEERPRTPSWPAASAEPAIAPVPESELPELPRRPPAEVGATGDRRVPFTRRRRLIADRMVASRRTIPEVTCVCEVDLARVAGLRREQAARGEKLTWLPFIARACVRALRELPELNATVGEESYTLKAEVNLGLAVETEAGLVVPVIRHADELSLVGLARAAEELAKKAREGHLAPDDVAGGTFTLSNPGPRGNLWGTPIILQPQVGILRMGELVKRPVVIEVDGGDAVAIRPMMHLALAYDHRIVDGVKGNGYLRRVKELLEAGDVAS